MDSFLNEANEFVGLGVALLLGLVIGAQRGWVDREREAGQRIAGIRTHMLIALLGGLCALLSQLFSQLILAVAFMAIAIVLTVAYLNAQKTTANKSITSLIGTLITFSLGALAVMGKPALAASAAVITALILDNKADIHQLLKKLENHELDAALKLLLISVVLLPLLPDEGFGPWNAINLYETWWMVVLIASISFVGYFAIKIGGTEKGILFTSLFAGLSSSTALTLHFSKLSKDDPSLSPFLASGILIACGTMFPRILLVCAIVNPALLQPLWLPIIVTTSLTYMIALIIWKMNCNNIIEEKHTHKRNPLELSSALFFGLVLLVIMLLSHALQAWLGDTGILLLSAVSGVSDVDAITLTLSRLSQNGLAIEIAVYGIIIAAAMNSLVKMSMTVFFGSSSLAWRVSVPLLIALVVGLSIAWLTL